MGRLIRKIAVLALLAGVVVMVGRKLGIIGGGDEFADDSDYDWASSTDSDSDTGQN